MAFLPSISSDPSPRASITFPDLTNPHHQRDPAAIMYDQGYDLKFSHVHSCDVKSSMLAYTEHMRTLSKARGESFRGNPDHLEINARHIPRYSPSKNGNSKRKVATFDELTGSVAKSPQSVKRTVTEREERLPLSPGQPSPVSKVRVSLVSASDLHEIIDLSLRMRGTKQDSLRMNRVDHNLKALEGFLPPGPIRRSHFSKSKIAPVPPAPRPSPNPPVEEPSPRKEEALVEDCVPDDLSTSSSELSDSSGEERMWFYGHEKLRRRPRRAKRMKLRRPNLGAIPEYETPQSEMMEEEPSHLSVPHSFVVLSPKSPVMFPTPESLSAIKGTRSHGQQGGSNSPSGAARKAGKAMRKSTLLPPLDLTTLSDESEEDSVKSETKSIKLKAQKKFRKLIFLRDFPDKHYQRSC